MKAKQLVLLLAAFSLFAPQAKASPAPLLLDAACKITCLAMVPDTRNECSVDTASQGYAPSYCYTSSQGNLIQEARYLYEDYLAVTREMLDQKTAAQRMTQLCHERLGKDSFFKDVNCLHLKHNN